MDRGPYPHGVRFYSAFVSFGARFVSRSTLNPDRVDSIGSIDMTDSIGSIARIDMTDSIDSVDSIASIDMTDSIDWISRVDSISRIDGIERIDRIGGIDRADRIQIHAPFACVLLPRSFHLAFVSFRVRH